MLNEAERDQYYYARNYNMTCLGTKDGAEIWRDNRTGEFYVDDGWDVRRVGTPGFVPHPVDREHMKALCSKYNPGNIPWIDFLLASYEGRYDELWRNFFEKYELGPKPNEPTWGKGIRKARWAEYGKQLDDWEAKKAKLEPEYTKEINLWKEKRQAYDLEHSKKQAATSGGLLLQRALSGGALSSVEQIQYRVQVPPGKGPGDTFIVQCGNQNMAVAVPAGAYPGMEISFMGPAPVVQAQAVQAIPVQQPAVSAPTPAIQTSAPPPPAIKTSAPPPPAISAPAAFPPPAIKTSAPPPPPPPPAKQASFSFGSSAAAPPPPPPAINVPVTKQSSIKW